MTNVVTRKRVAATLVLAGVAVLIAQRPGSQPAAPPLTSTAAPEGKAAPGAARGGPRASKRAALTAPATPRRAVHPTPREVVARAAWGSGPENLGRLHPGEGEPIAPPAFVVDREGRAHVLDQVNARVQVFEKGKPTRSVSLPADTYQDIAVDAAGRTVVMDRLATGTLAFIDPNGEMRHTVPLVGPNVPEGGGVTALFSRPDGTWVEVEHDRLVRVALASGEPDPDRPTVAGRFTRDGSAIMRAAIRDGRVDVVSEPMTQGGKAFQTSVTFPLSVLGIHALEQDAHGRTFLVANLIQEGDIAPYDVVEERETAVVLGENGAEVARVELAPPEGPEEQLRPITVGDDGSIYQLVAGAEAATIERFEP